ncbi:MAG: hypothetical protein V7459_12820 [Oceanicoccus sp.]
MSEQKLEENRVWFSDFGPMHELWLRLERGMQIILGVALITIFGFLGESWGSENVPYDNIIAAAYRIAWAFAVSIFLSPFVFTLGIIASKTLPASRETRGRIYLVVLLLGLGYCWTLLYVSTADVLEALVEVTGAASPLDDN